MKREGRHGGAAPPEAAVPLGEHDEEFRSVASPKSVSSAKSAASRRSGASRAAAAKDGASGMQLQWAKAPFKDFVGCALEQVLCLGYGYAARAWALFPDVAPERCFTVYTAKRCHDFVCASERDAGVFIVVLSRLCSQVQGWPLPGGISTLARFQSAKGWLKVQASGRANREPLQARLASAIKRSLHQGATQQASHLRPALRRPTQATETTAPAPAAGPRGGEPAAVQANMRPTAPRDRAVRFQQGRTSTNESLFPPAQPPAQGTAWRGPAEEQEEEGSGEGSS